MRILRGTALCATIVLIIAGGCQPATDGDADAVRDVVERGPLQFVVEARRAQVQVADTVTVALTVEAPPEYEVGFPAPDAFGELAAREVEAPAPRPGAEGTLWRRTYAFEPLASGTVEIPALTVTYTRRPTEAETQPTPAELTSAPLTIAVTSVLTGDDEPTRPRDITGTLLPPPPPMGPRELALRIGGIMLVALALLLAAWRLYRWMMTDPPPTPPEVWALRELEQLAQADWDDPEQLRGHYYRLTEIVRAYIERKFALAAPEMTTEEFLSTLARDRRALPYDADRLRDFLEACDMVKYAAVTPTREEAEGVLATARAFVHATAAAADRAAQEQAEGNPPGPGRPPGSSAATYCVQPAGREDAEGGAS